MRGLVTRRSSNPAHRGGWIAKAPPVQQSPLSLAKVRARGERCEPKAAAAISHQCPAGLNAFASSPAVLKAAMASFEVTATVVFKLLMLPPAAPTMATDSAE